MQFSAGIESSSFFTFLYRNSFPTFDSLPLEILRFSFLGSGFSILEFFLSNGLLVYFQKGIHGKFLKISNRGMELMNQMLFHIPIYLFRFSRLTILLFQSGTCSIENLFGTMSGNECYERGKKKLTLFSLVNCYQAHPNAKITVTN